MYDNEFVHHRHMLDYNLPKDPIPTMSVSFLSEEKLSYSIEYSQSIDTHSMDNIVDYNLVVLLTYPYN